MNSTTNKVKNPDELVEMVTIDDGIKNKIKMNRTAEINPESIIVFQVSSFSFFFPIQLPHRPLIRDPIPFSMLAIIPLM